MSDEGHILAWRTLEEDSAGFLEGHGDEECRKAAAKAMSLLLQQDRTKKNLMDRLYRGGFSERASEYALQYVMHFGYVDDLRYAQNYISCHKGHRSQKELRYKLLERGVPQETISEAFLGYEEEEEGDALRKVLGKRLKGRQLSGLDYPAREKITAYLVRKGYSLSKVRAVMREWTEEEA